MRRVLWRCVTALDSLPVIIPVRSPAARASFKPAPSYALNPLISLAVPSRRESSQMRPSVSTPSTSISNTRIFFARAFKDGLDPFPVRFFAIRNNLLSLVVCSS